MRGVVSGILAVVCVSASLTAQVPDSTSPQLVREGKAVFEGRAGGALCFTCHGPNGKGIPGLGPDLTDAKWLHGDGGFDFLQRIVKSGVPKPKQSATIMPPMGGGKLSDAQLAALAAYLRSLSP
jgi:mono/diheme cytochrome c family protein